MLLKADTTTAIPINSQAGQDASDDELNMCQDQDLIMEDGNNYDHDHDHDHDDNDDYENDNDSEEVENVDNDCNDPTYGIRRRLRPRHKVVLPRSPPTRSTNHFLPQSRSCSPSDSSSSSNSSNSKFKAREFTFLNSGGPRITGGTSIAPPPLAVVAAAGSDVVYRHSLNKDVQTVEDVLQEWRFGFQGGPALQDLDHKWGGKWRIRSEKCHYQNRMRIVKTYRRWVLERGQTDEDAIQLLENLRQDRSVSILSHVLREERYRRGIDSHNGVGMDNNFNIDISSGSSNSGGSIIKDSSTGLTGKKRKRFKMDGGESDQRDEESDNLDQGNTIHGGAGKGRYIAPGPTISSSSRRLRTTTKGKAAQYQDTLNTQSKVVFKASEFLFGLWSTQNYMDSKGNGKSREKDTDDKDRKGRIAASSSAAAAALLPTTYLLNKQVETVRDALQEWRYGFQGGPAIQDLNLVHAGKWKAMADRNNQTYRSFISKEFVRLVLEEGHSEEGSIQILENLRNGASLCTLHVRLRKQHQQLEKERGKTSLHTKNGNGGRNDDDNEDDDGARSSPPPAPEFPFPIRRLHSISDIWKEWTLGWDKGSKDNNNDNSGQLEPPLEDLVQIHGRLWHREVYKNAYAPIFSAKNRYVQLIRKAVANGNVSSPEEAIRQLEAIRGVKSPSIFFRCPAFKALEVSWGKCGNEEGLKS